MRRVLSLSSFLLLMVLAMGCPPADDDDFSRTDDDDATADDDDATADDDDSVGDDDDDDAGDDDDASETCPRVDGIIDLGPNPPGGIVNGPLTVAVFEAGMVGGTVPLGKPLDAVEVEVPTLPYTFSICSRPGGIVVTAIYDVNDGEICTPGDLWVSTTGDAIDGGTLDLGTLLLENVVAEGDCEREGKNPN